MAKLYLGTQKVTPVIRNAYTADFVFKPTENFPMTVQMQYRELFLNKGYTIDVDLTNLPSINVAMPFVYAFTGNTINNVNIPRLQATGNQGGISAMFDTKDNDNATIIKNIHIGEIECTNSGTFSITFCGTTITGNIDCNLKGLGVKNVTNVMAGFYLTFDGASFTNTVFHFKKLEYVYGTRQLQGCFRDSNITEIYFDSLEDSDGLGWTDMISGCSNVTIHFPSNMESIVKTWVPYPNFGGTNTVLAFDLPTTT